MAKTPRTTLAWPVLHNFTPAVESLSQEMYFLLTPAWFVPRWRRQHSMPPIVPSSNSTGDGKASAKALPQTQSQPMSEKNIHDFPYVHRPFFRQGTPLCLLPPLLWARRRPGGSGATEAAMDTFLLLPFLHHHTRIFIQKNLTGGCCINTRHFRHRPLRVWQKHGWHHGLVRV